MAAIFGLGGPIILPWTVRGDRFSGGTVHGVTDPLQDPLTVQTTEIDAERLRIRLYK